MKAIYTLILLATYTISQAANPRTDIQLRLTDIQIGGSDITSIAFKSGFTPAYLSTEDIEKTFNNGTQGVQIYTVTTDNIACSVNNYSPLAQSENVNLGFVTYHSGSYLLSISSAQNVDATTLIILEDKIEHTYHLLNNNAFTFNTDSGTFSNRFALHISSPVVATTLPANCSGVNGQANVITDAQAGWEEIALIDSNGLSVQQTQNINGPVNFANLTEGNYTVRLSYGSFNTTLPATVAGTSVSANILTDESVVSESSSIKFTGNAAKVKYYEWDMGDGAIISGVANPEYTYFQTGTYNVTLRVSNDYGCADSANKTITVTQATGISTIDNNNEIYSAQKQLYIKMGTMPETAITVSVYNIIGQNVYSAQLNSSNTTIDLSAQQNGAYIVSLQQGRNAQTKRVYLY